MQAPRGRTRSRLGITLQQRWHDFEKMVWPAWARGVDRPCTLWTWGARVLVPARIVVPSMEWLCDLRVNQWVMRFPEDDALVEQHRLLLDATGRIRWASPHSRQLAVSNGLRLLLVRGYRGLHQIQDEDLKALSMSLEGGRRSRRGLMCAWRLRPHTQTWIDTPQPPQPSDDRRARRCLAHTRSLPRDHGALP